MIWKTPLKYCKDRNCFTVCYSELIGITEERKQSHLFIMKKKKIRVQYGYKDENSCNQLCFNKNFKAVMYQWKCVV